MLYRTTILLLILLLSLQLCSALNVWLWLINQVKRILIPNFPREVDEVLEEAGLTTPELIERDGYFPETFTTQTRDGYILTLHRIPYGKTNKTREGRIPVIYIPGIGCSSSMFVDREGTSIGYMLADSGFDVWMGNLRGSVYSREHVEFHEDEDKFWDFTMDDQAKYDVTAIIDFVLHETESKHIQMISHSMGGVIALLTLAANPEYNHKVKGAVHLAPGVYMKYITTLYRPVIRAGPIGQKLFDALGIRELFRNTPFSRLLLFSMCPSEDPFLCEVFFYTFVGFKPKINRKKATYYINHCPTGAATALFFHYGQLHLTNEVRYYDYGSSKLNIQKYGQRIPPIYNLKKITSPMAIFYGKNDPLADPIDIALLIKDLNSSIYNYLIPAPLFTHVDFMWGDEAEKLVYIPLIETLRKMWRGPDP